MSIFGNGNWALTLADLAYRSGSAVCLYARRDDVARHLRAKRQHPEFLPHLRLDGSIHITSSLRTAANSSRHWVIAVPSQYVRPLAASLAAFVSGSHSVLSASKGLERQSLVRMTEVLQQEWAGRGRPPAISALSGPNLAIDISLGRPAASVLATQSADFPLWTGILGGANLRLYHQTDVAGVELGGALKNILAIAVGIADQTELGDSAKAALVTRGLHEMGRLAVRLGANWTTLAGLSGLGDVVATASSPHSRNHWCGQELGKGRSLAEILAGTSMVVEGVGTTEAAYALGQELAIPLPITNQVLAIFRGKAVSAAVRDLMTRALVNESEF
ncbi:MAG: NAD(P)-dependent glycerol-3-phosphate dehydrogenase [Thermaerobacter sp.]|nr:NAD(P)-dependent glycerol-3-phosphate dehydrogenase [Thermaerobacter sp.]